MEFATGLVVLLVSMLLFALARSGTLIWSADACVKFLGSFLKHHWRLSDYPVRLGRMPPDLPSPGNPLGETWMAYIENGAVAGFGPTPEAAWQDLAGRFKVYTSVYDPPRPGLRWRGLPVTGDLEGADPQVFL